MTHGHETPGRALKKGDIVRLKPKFDQSLEGLAVRRAGLPLRENCLYQVIDLKAGEIGVVLTLIEVRVFHLGGARHVAKIGYKTFPYVSERFELMSPS